MSERDIRGLVERLREKAKDRADFTRTFPLEAFIEWEAADALASLLSKVEELERELAARDQTIEGLYNDLRSVT